LFFSEGNPTILLVSESGTQSKPAIGSNCKYFIMNPLHIKWGKIRRCGAGLTDGLFLGLVGRAFFDLPYSGRGVLFPLPERRVCGCSLRLRKES
jgi:hypothetical protein